MTEPYMHRALGLARLGEGRTRPNPPVGAVVVRDGAIVGEGFHPEAGKPHAEIYALKEAGESARGADLYVTLEPCSHHGRTGPCAEAVIDAGIRRVYVGVQDPNPLVAGRGVERLRAAGIEVIVGLLEKECRHLIAPFARHVTTGMPFVILKTAITLDGKTATVTGDSRWISNEESRAHVHRLRDRVDGIMVGIGTVLHDNPRLDTRLPEGGRNPVKIIVDTRLETSPDAAIFDSKTPVIIAAGEGALEDRARILTSRGAQIWRFQEINGRIDLASLMRRLGEEGMQTVLLEGGAGLNRSFLDADLIDRFMVFVAPKIVGGEGKGIFSGLGVERLKDAILLDDLRTSTFGDDTPIEGEVRRCLRD